MRSSSQTRRQLAAAAVALLSGIAVPPAALPQTPEGCDQATTFYSSHPEAQDFFPYGFYGAPGCHPLLGMPAAISAEVSLERFAGYGVNVVLTSLDAVPQAGATASLGEVGRHLYTTLLPRYEIKTLCSVASRGFRFDSEAFSGLQRNTPLLNAVEMASVEQKLAGKLKLAADVAQAFPDVILGFVSDDEPHLMAPAVAAARLLQEHTGRLATFPMPTYDTTFAFAEHMQPMMADWYVCSNAVRDNWAIASRMRSLAHTRPGRIIWFVPLAISYTGAHEATLPNLQDARTTRAELRLQCWSALAMGAKAILFYNPGGWAFTWGGNEDALFDTMGRPNAPNDRQDNLAEIRELSADFTAIGPSLLTACPLVEPAVQIACETVRYAMYTGPALGCGLLRDAERTRDFLVPWNNDISGERHGTLTIPRPLLGEGRNLYDLHALREVEVGDGGSLEVSLPPGGGHVYMLGDAASFATVRDDILRHRVRPERVRARSLLNRVQTKAGFRADSGDFSDAKAAVAQAQAAETARDWQQAASAYRQAITALEKIATGLSVVKVEAALDRAGTAIAAAEDLLRTHDVRLYNIPPMTDTTKLLDTKLPVHAEQNALIALMKRYLDLEYRLFSGVISEDRVAAALATANDLQRDAGTYRRSLWRKFSDQLAKQRKPIRVALITPDRDGIEETMAYAWAYGQCEACWIAPNEDGTLTDTEGHPFEPDHFDVVWVHQIRFHSSPPANGQIEPAQALMPALMEPAVIASLRDYVSAGGGLLLTGIAGLYAVPLEIETVAPDRIRENDSFSRDLAVGIFPSRGASGHPALAHVPAEGHLTNGGPPAQVVAPECAWEKRQPTGSVLAFELDAQYGRLAELAVMVEYVLGTGKVLVLGGLGCDLTPGNSPSVEGNVATARVRRMMLDVLEYLTTTHRHAVDATAEAAAAASVAKPLGKRDAPPSVGPSWIQNARARVEMLSNQQGFMPAFRYLRWNANEGKWMAFLPRGTIGSDILDKQEAERVRAKYGVYSTFDGVNVTNLVPTATDDGVSLQFRLERPDTWAAYRLSLIGDSPFLLVEQTEGSRPDMVGRALMILDQPMRVGIAGLSDNPADVAEHRAIDQRDQGWLLRMKRYFVAADPADSRVLGVFAAAVDPPSQVVLMTPGIRQFSQLSMPFFFVGVVAPIAADTAALRNWADDQFAPLERYFPRRP